jgi:hypothetical protein
MGPRPQRWGLRYNGAVRIVEEENRVRIFFPNKPAEPVRVSLKGRGFRWSPAAGAWQAYASENAWYWARKILNELRAP